VRVYTINDLVNFGRDEVSLILCGNLTIIIIHCLFYAEAG